MEDLGFCNVCGAPSKYVCSRCSDSYCSVKCQASDWPTHRSICFPMPKLVERNNIPNGKSVMELPKKVINIHKTSHALPKQISLEKDFEVDRRPRVPKVEVPRQPNVMSQTLTAASKEITESSLEPVTKESIYLITMMVSKGITSFIGQLGTIFTDHFFSVIVDLPDMFSEKFDGVMKDFDKEVPTFQDGTISVGTMFALEGPKSKFTRATVVASDLDSKACIMFHCDLGSFVVLHPIPEKVKVCPAKYSELPGKALVVELLSVVDNDPKKYLTDFYKPDNIFSFDIKKKLGELFSGQVNLNGKQAGLVSVYETAPNINLCNIPYWSTQIPSETIVKVVRIKFLDNETRAWITPTDKSCNYEELLFKIGQKLPHCKSIPNKNTIVLHLQGSRGARLLVKNHSSDDVVDLFDFDLGRTYKCEWKQLKVANEFVRSLPAYGMSVKLADVCEIKKHDREEIDEHLTNEDYRKKDYVLSYSGYSGNGVKLICGNETLGSIITKYVTDKKNAREELARKQKEREAEELIRIQKQKEREAEELIRKQREREIQELARKQKEREAEELAQKQREEEQKLKEELERKKAQEELQKNELAEKETRIKLEEESKSEASTKISSPPSSKSGLLAQRLAKLKVVDSKKTKIFISDMNLIPLEVGKISKFIVTDAGSDGMAGVCESTPINATFLSEIMTLCEKCVSKLNVKELLGYRPEENEMCLALYDEDEGWYRAQNLGETNGKFMVLLIDFGTIYFTTESKLMPFPEELKGYPPRTHLVFIEDSDKKKTNELQALTKHRFLVKSVESNVYTLSFV